MKIHEYQAKRLLKEFDIPVPEGEVAETPEQARKIAEKLGAGKMVVKAQIHAGGRGKGGGIKVASTPEEAEKLSGQIIGMKLVTPQTGPEGKQVRKVLLEEGISIKKELYLGITIDRAACCPMIVASEAGGMEIEEVARSTPDKILREQVDPILGLRGFQTRKLAYGLGLEQAVIKQAAPLISNLYRLFHNKDASLAEINPLVITEDDRLLALDAKVDLDDSGLNRHKELLELRDPNEEEPLEVEASKYNLNYIKLDGSVGCLVNGAGLAMATMDLIKQVGLEPANFLDVGGQASAEMVENAFRILLSDEKVKAVLINIFGGILRCDTLATGIVEAGHKLEIKVPMVIRLEGTNVEQGQNILNKSGLNFTVAADMKEAAEKIASTLK
ncbi:MAG: ADP-forming succinate--CoA ligase subunit beta [Deltaproteobacteria bacterium]|nr:MAG: ADP-forming succinate--CoA ligase subunit beta [Deltaproteobacteria bacterium]